MKSSLKCAAGIVAAALLTLPSWALGPREPGAAGAIAAKPAGAARIVVEASSPEDLLADPDRVWSEVREGVWRTNDGGVELELAFGEAAVEIALQRLDRSIEKLRDAHSRGELSARDGIRLLELELERAELADFASEIGAKLVYQPSPRPVCFGNAWFEHEYWFLSVTTPFVRSKSTYSESWPTFGGKTTYAEAEVCFTVDGTTYCDTPSPDSDYSTTSHVTSEVTAYTGPTFQCAGNAYGFVLVSDSVDSCWNAAGFSSSASCSEF